MNRPTLFLSALMLSMSVGGAAHAEKKSTPKKSAAKPAPKAKPKPPVAAKAVERVAKKNGIALLAHVVADFDGDGLPDFVGACQDDTKKVSVCLWDKSPKGPRLVKTLPGGGGNRFKSLKVHELIPPASAKEIALEFYGDNPDEKIKRLRVYSGYGKAREIFTSVIFRPKDKSLRESWERDGDVIAYGNARGGWYFEDIDADGMSEVLVRRKPRILKIERDGQEPAKLVVGVRETVFAYVGNQKTGKYRQSEKNRFVDFVPAYDIASVTASSAWVPPQILEDLEADALAEAVYAASDENAEMVVPDVVVDRQPYTNLAIDKDLATGWAEDAKGPGLSEWIEVDLGAPKDIHMVRVVLGCVSDRKTYKAFNVPVKFELTLDGDERTFVNTNATERPLKPAVAIKKLPLRDKKFAAQTLVFFNGTQKAQKVRLTILDVKKQGRKHNTCISEIAVH